MQSDTYLLEKLGLRRKKKEKIKFPDAYVRGSFSPPYEAVGLPLEGGWAVVETTYRKRKVSSGAKLGALDHRGSIKPTTRPNSTYSASGEATEDG